MKFTKKDLFFALISGFITGLIIWKILGFLGLESVYGISLCWLILAVPIIWVAGVNLGYFLGRWMGFFNQFGKFAAIGFTNAAVDFGVLNALIAWTGETAGIHFAIFKGASFVVAVTQSFFWNKFWVFSGSKSENQGAQFAKFFGVNVLAAIINISVASAVVNLVNPVFGLDAKIWANVSAVAGSAVALAFSFIGFRMAVFRRK